MSRFDETDYRDEEFCKCGLPLDRISATDWICTECERTADDEEFVWQEQHMLEWWEVLELEEWEP